MKKLFMILLITALLIETFQAAPVWNNEEAVAERGPAGPPPRQGGFPRGPHGRPPGPLGR